MFDRARQLVLDLPLATSFGADDFLVSPSNRHAFETVEAWPNWPDTVLHLRGPAGSGKSHLAAIWASRAGAGCVRAGTVAGPDVPSLASVPALVIEDLDIGPVDEAALFHLLNLTRERGGSILLTSARPVDELALATPDLLSRLRLAPRIELGPPDDALLKSVLVKLFADRQLLVDANVVEYVAMRIERSLARAATIVAELDREALSRGRRVTRPVAAEIIARHTDVAD